LTCGGERNVRLEAGYSFPAYKKARQACIGHRGHPEVGDVFVSKPDTVSRHIKKPGATVLSAPGFLSKHKGAEEYRAAILYDLVVGIQNNPFQNGQTSPLSKML